RFHKKSLRQPVFEDYSAINNRKQNVSLVDFGRVDGIKVPVNQDNISKFPGRNASFHVFGKLSISRPDRVGPDRIIQRNFLLRHPPLWMLAIESLPGDRCFDSFEWIEWRHRPVRTEC